MTVLLDANALIALLVDDHVHHMAAENWFTSMSGNFAACPVTQGSPMRLLIREGQPAATAQAVLSRTVASSRHEFWPDDVPYTDVPAQGIIGHRQVTDAYLAQLARRRQARREYAVAGLKRVRQAAGVNMHADQLMLSPAMVRELVDDQFPRWRDLAIKAVESPGTDNAIFRIGGQLAARFPLKPGDVAEVRRRLESEAAAARELAGRTRFATPEPVAIGEPGAGYPLPWAVQTWLPGDTATDRDPGDSVAFAHDLAEFIGGVRSIDTGGRTFKGRGRGGELLSHDEWMQTCFDRSEDLLDVPRLRRLWEAMRALPRGAASDVMSHRDLIPGNVLVSGGRLAGVLDVGDMGPADPALDLVAAWHLLEERPRQTLRGDLRCDDLEWERGKGWAFQQAMGLVWYYLDSNPAMSRLGRRTLDRIQGSA